MADEVRERLYNRAARLHEMVAIDAPLILVAYEVNLIIRALAELDPDLVNKALTEYDAVH